MKNILLPLLLLATTLAPAHVGAQAARSEPALPRTAEYDYDLPEPGTYLLPVLKPAEDGAVLDSAGKPARLHDLLDNRITILSFIYTRCTDPRACLRASGVLKQLQQLTRTDPSLSTNVLLLTLSFDPAHDTPEVMRRYGRVFNETATGADWLFLTTESREVLAPLLDHYGQQVDPGRPGSARPFNHPLRVYLIDGKKRIRNIYSFGLFDPRLVMTDVQTLLLEASKPAITAPTPESSAIPHHRVAPQDAQNLNEKTIAGQDRP